MFDYFMVDLPIVPDRKKVKIYDGKSVKKLAKKRYKANKISKQSRKRNRER